MARSGVMARFSVFAGPKAGRKPSWWVRQDHTVLPEGILIMRRRRAQRSYESSAGMRSRRRKST